MDWLNEFVKESLPTPWSRRVAITTVSITLPCFGLPEFLQKIGLSIAGTETLSFRLSVVLAILLLGSLFTLALVVRAYNDMSSQHASEIEALKNTKPEMKISSESLNLFSGIRK